MGNESATKEEYVFIMFEDVLKAYTPSILKLLLTKEYREEMEDLIDYSKFETLDDKGLNMLSIKRTTKNILDFIKKEPFDTSLTLLNMLYSHPECYTGSENLSMVPSLDILCSQPFTKKVYIYTETVEYGIPICVAKLFAKHNQCKLITGDFKSAIKTIEEDITLFVINDADRLYDLIECDKVKYTDILIANYGYNYIYDEEQKCPILKITDINKLSKAGCFRLNMFMPYRKERLK